MKRQQAGGHTDGEYRQSGDPPATAVTRDVAEPAPPAGRGPGFFAVCLDPG